MRAGLLLAVVCAVVFIGCAPDSGPPAPAPSPEPMPTDGSNQVVIHVPEMTCEGCAATVERNVSGVPWVVADSVQTDRKTRQVKFAVTDRARFNLDEVKKALGSHYARGAAVLTTPTEK